MDGGRRTAREEKPSERGVRGGRKSFRSRLRGRMASAVQAEKQAASRGLPTDKKLKEVRGAACLFTGSPPPERLIGGGPSNRERGRRRKEGRRTASRPASLRSSLLRGRLRMQGSPSSASFQPTSKEGKAWSNTKRSKMPFGKGTSSRSVITGSRGLSYLAHAV